MKRIETDVFVVMDQDGLLVGFNEQGDQVRIHGDDFANNIDDVTYSDCFCRADDPSIKSQGWTAYRVILEEINEKARCCYCKYSYDDLTGRVCTAGEFVDKIVSDDFCCNNFEKEEEDGNN